MAREKEQRMEGFQRSIEEAKDSSHEMLEIGAIYYEVGLKANDSELKRAALKARVRGLIALSKSGS